MIWQRYFLREIIKVFALFLFGFFFLYSAIDYSMHMQDFLKDKSIQIIDVLNYYGLQFIKRAPLLMPLALLIATIKVLTTLSSHHELVALQISGLSFKRLMRPFFLVASVCVLFNLLSAEFLVPMSTSFLDKFYDDHLRRGKNGKDKYEVHSITLKDNSKLIYKSRDLSQNQFFDVIWLKSADEIWRIKYLANEPKHPTGKYVDRLVRTPEGFFEKQESFESRNFKEISWDKDLPRKGFVPFENRSVSELFRLGFQKSCPSFMKMEVLSQFYYKCAIPFLSLIVVIAVAPYCIQYARRAPLFLLYSAALFGYIAFFTLMDSALVLGGNRVLPPLLAIFTPLLLLTLPFLRKFQKT